MGDRLLTLDPGSDTAALVPARDTLAGRFVIGPSEALGMVGRLREVVSGFAELSFVLLHGDARHPSLVQQYARIARVADSLSVRLLALSRQLDGGFSRRAHALYHLTGTTARLSADLTEATPQMLAELRARVDAIAKAADDLEALVRKARPLVAKIDSPEARALGERLDHLQQQLTDLRSSLQDVRHRGVNLLLWPF
jgi:predicted  nucleic acid-binding Zn-ribbon protein